VLPYGSSLLEAAGLGAIPITDGRRCELSTLQHLCATQLDCLQALLQIFAADEAKHGSDSDSDGDGIRIYSSSTRQRLALLHERLPLVIAEAMALAGEPDVVRLGLQCLVSLLFSAQGRLAGQQWADSNDEVAGGKNRDNLLKLLVRQA